MSYGKAVSYFVIFFTVDYFFAPINDGRSCLSLWMGFLTDFNIAIEAHQSKLVSPRSSNFLT